MPHLKPSKKRIELGQVLSDEQLPALPQSAIRLLELARDPENEPAKYVVPIEADPGLTGQVLRFVNSSFFGFRQEIASVQRALSLVGVRTIKNFALWSAVFSLLPAPKCGPFELKRLWQDSLRRGIFARILGDMLRLTNSDDLFVAALLQDMAIPLLARELSVQYEQLLRSRNNGEKRLSDLEQDELGWTHAEAGGLMARQWHLPDSSASMIQRHCAGEKLEQRATVDPRESAVILSAWLPSTSDDFWPERVMLEESLRSLVGTNNRSLATVFQRVDSEFTQFAPFFRLSSAGKSLSEFLVEREATAL